MYYSFRLFPLLWNWRLFRWPALNKYVNWWFRDHFFILFDEKGGNLTSHLVSPPLLQLFLLFLLPFLTYVLFLEGMTYFIKFSFVCILRRIFQHQDTDVVWLEGWTWDWIGRRCKSNCLKIKFKKFRPRYGNTLNVCWWIMDKWKWFYPIYICIKCDIIFMFLFYKINHKPSTKLALIS